MLKEWLLNLLYPPRCPGCGAAVSRHGQWCSSCFGAVWRPRRLARKRESRLTACYCLCDYRGPVRTMLQRLKYDGAVRYERAAEALLTQFPWPERLGHIDCVVPVPLAPGKERKRGFNQAAELAARLGELLSLPIDDGLLIRAKKTARQKDLNPAQRLANLEQAFSVPERRKKEGKLPESVILVDDIYTTGSTIEACTRALKAAGVKRVYFVSICIGSER